MSPGISAPARVLHFTSTPERLIYFLCGPTVFPLRSGIIEFWPNHAVRGWFFSFVPITREIYGALAVASVKGHAKIDGLWVAAVDIALGMHRAEFTSSSAEVMPAWQSPALLPELPETMEELQRLFAGETDGAMDRARFDGEGKSSLGDSSHHAAAHAITIRLAAPTSSHRPGSQNELGLGLRPRPHSPASRRREVAAADRQHPREKRVLHKTRRPLGARDDQGDSGPGDQAAA